jgi:hypothetical protein
MKLKNGEKFAFIAMGVAALNMALMANGVETMPGMWMKEVYQEPSLGASIGGITGAGIGAMVGATYIAAQETVKTSISMLRNKFLGESKIKKLTI